MTMKFHPLCRPPRGANGWRGSKEDAPLKLGANGKWRADDGKPGLAFIGSLSGENLIWVSKCKCIDAKCPRWKAFEHAREELEIESISVHERETRAAHARATR